MKTKKFLVILSVLLCLGMLFVACAKTDDDKEGKDGSEEVTLSAAESKDKIAQLFNKTDFKNLTADMDFSTLLKNVLGTDQLSASVEDNPVLAVKDNYIYDAMDDMWIYVGGTTPIMFAKDETGKWVESTSEEGAGAVVPGVPADMLDSLETLELPEVMAADIIEKDGKFVLSNAYVKAVAKSIVKSAMGDMATAETETMIDEIADSLGLEIAFTMGKTNVEKLAISVDVDEKKLGEAIGTAENMPDIAEDEGIKANIELTLDEKAEALKDLKVSYEMKIKDVTQKLDAKFIPALDAEKKLTGCDVELYMGVLGTYLTSQTINDDSHFVFYGNEEFNITAKLDLTKLNAAAGATVLDIDGTEKVTLSKVEKVSYDADGNKKSENATLADTGLTEDEINTMSTGTVDVVTAENGTLTVTVKEDNKEVGKVTINLKSAGETFEVPAGIKAIVESKNR